MSVRSFLFSMVILRSGLVVLVVLMLISRDTVGASVVALRGRTGRAK